MAKLLRKIEPKQRAAKPYQEFEQINGEHPFKDAVPFGYVDYEARVRPNGKLAYFNFDLAREMSLIPENHPDEYNDDLRQAVINSFGLVIINEHDFLNKKSISENEVKPNRYMATRYLQLQHPSKVGKTSGDGRSIWNGYFRGDKLTWDISSCGTGATCLSPARAKTGKFFRTGDPSVSYGCGFAELSEGISNAVFSELMHRNGVPTERTLAVIEYPKGSCVVVRAHPNLLRPSHFFNHLRQGKLERLRGAVELFIERQIKNRKWKNVPTQPIARYEFALKQFAHNFARMAAVFEREYIFCWLDWDGDNILADGSIIDYGSIRQFGLFHHEYRYDDVERWSTNIKEQKQKARLIVQTMSQMFSYLSTGKRRPLQDFKQHRVLREFDEVFDSVKIEVLLKKCGFDLSQIEYLTKHHRGRVQDLERSYDFFERAKSSKGRVRVEDGVNWHAIFNMRCLLRELTSRYAANLNPVSAREMIGMMRSTFASRRDCNLSRESLRKLHLLQDNYLFLIAAAARHSKKDVKTAAVLISKRAAVLNRQDRITGDGMIFVGQWLMKRRKSLTDNEFNALVMRMVNEQSTAARGEHGPKSANVVDLKLVRMLKDVRKLICETSEGI
jgi:uncharacterized protein YdiU (UPF0061 family)